MDARAYLYSLERFGIKLGLDNIRYLLEQAGEPQRAFPSIHVAGTNGKGSVVAMLDAIFRAAGYSTGRFTSPHLITLNERFLLNAAPIRDDELDRQLAFVRRIAEPMQPNPTFFEAATAACFRWFAEQRVDMGLIEVGLGGRFDSTNVITPACAAITNIGLEHTQYLGETLELIAFEKAGIIKPGVPVVVSETHLGPLGVILEQARALDSPAKLLGRDFHYALAGGRFTYESERLRIGPVDLGLQGAYQGVNAAVAVAVAETLREQFPRLLAGAIAQGLSQARWPGRFERVLETPPVIMDVAHNYSGAQQLAPQLGPSIIMMAVSGDKAAERMIDELAPYAAELLLTQYAGSRSLPVDVLCAAAHGRPHRRFERLGEAVDYGMAHAHAGLPFVITGSVFTVGEARTWLMEHYGAPGLVF